MIRQVINKLRKPISIGYIHKYLRSKGIATNERGENNLTFKLYDTNWDLFCEKERVGLRCSLTLGNDIDMQCMLQAANELNNERWIVKAFINTYTAGEEDNTAEKISISSIIFSFESFCYSEADFGNIYEFAIYALTDGIEYHRKAYVDLLNKHKSKSASTPIGFHTESTVNEGTSVAAADNQKRNRIGFV